MKTVSLMLFLLISYISISCSNIDKNKIEEIGKLWKIDKIGCKGHRNKIVTQDLNILKEGFENKKTNLFSKFLGKPNEIWKENDSELYVYWASLGIQCRNSTEEITDALRLIVEIKQGKVIRIYTRIS